MNNFFSLIVNTWRYRHSYCWRLETKSTWFTRALVQLLVSMSGVVSSFELPQYPPVADTTITHSVMLAPRDNKISSDNKAQISSDNQRSRGQFLHRYQDFLFPSPFVLASLMRQSASHHLQIKIEIVSCIGRFIQFWCVVQLEVITQVVRLVITD